MDKKMLSDKALKGLKGACAMYHKKSDKAEKHIVIKGAKSAAEASAAIDKINH